MPRRSRLTHGRKARRLRRRCAVSSPVRFNGQTFSGQRTTSTSFRRWYGDLRYASQANHGRDVIEAGQAVADQVPSNAQAGLLYPLQSIFSRPRSRQPRGGEIVFDSSLARVARPADMVALSADVTSRNNRTENRWARVLEKRFEQGIGPRLRPQCSSKPKLDRMTPGSCF